MSARTFICFLLIASQFMLPLSVASPKTVPAVSDEDQKKAAQLKTTKLDFYFVKGFEGTALPQALQDDILILIRKGAELALFSADFEKWWLAQKMSPGLLKEYKDMTTSEFVALLYAKYLSEKAQKLDDADPKTTQKKQQGDVTDGEYWIIRQMRKVVDNPWLMASAVGVAGGVAWLVKSVVDTVWHGFVAGPVAATVNTAMEPFAKPVQDRIRQVVNKKLAQRNWVKRYTIFWTGEEGKRRAAMQAASDGREITGDAAHYDMPGVEVEDFSKDTRTFFDEMLAADLRWRGWTLDEVARARQTGFMILFEQPRLIGEQIQSAQSRIDIVRIRQILDYSPPLLSKGVTQEELTHFNELLKQIHILKKFKSPLDPEIPPLEEKVVALAESWIQRGVKREDIQAYRESEKQYLVAKDRTAFVMASVLYAELYFQEYNRALNNLNQLQKWQELSREMNGFYETLEEHKDAIEMYFAKKGLKYNVQQRIDERGYPLGGPRRPDGVPPLRDRLDTYFQTGNLNTPIAWRSQSQPTPSGEKTAEPDKPKDQPTIYRSRRQFQSDMDAIAKKLNEMIERSLTSRPDPLLDIQISATLDAAYTKLLGAPADWRDKLTAFWLELKSLRFPRIQQRVEQMRQSGPLHSQIAAGIRLERVIGRNLYAVNCVLRFRDLKALRPIDAALADMGQPPAPGAPIK